MISDARSGGLLRLMGRYATPYEVRPFVTADPPPPPGTTGLFHTAIRYPDRRTLADAVRRVLDAGIPLTGASDHGVSEAIYLRDPDQNGIELYRDRPREEWPREDGGVAMISVPLDLQSLLAEA